MIGHAPPNFSGIFNIEYKLKEKTLPYSVREGEYVPREGNNLKPYSIKYSTDSTFEYKV